MLLGVTIPLLMLHMKVETEVTESSDLALGGVSTQMPEGDVDFIDYKGLGGGFTDVYFGEHRVLLDGHELKRTRDFRLLPMGENVRLVFIRPVVGNEIKFTADHRLVRFGPFLDTYVGTYHFSLGLPKPFREKQSVEMISGYRLGDRLEFSRHGAGHFYVGDGWSGAEDWGRWSVGKKARIEMRLSKNLSEPLTLEFTLGALVHPKQPCQRVRVLANGSELGVEEICLNNDGNALKSFIYVLPGNLISSDRRLTIELVTPDAFSQKELGINDDERIIGVGLKSLRIH